MDKKRLFPLDNLKFVLIVFVVIGHLIDYGSSEFQADAFHRMAVFIYAFHMPLFIFISGMFFMSEHILRKVLYYLLTGLVMKATVFLFQRLIYHTGLFTFSNLNGPDWFMLALAVYTALMYWLRRCKGKWILAVALPLALAAGYIDAINTFMSVSRVVVFFPFFVLGTMLPPDAVIRFVSKRKWRVTGSVLIAVWAVLNIFWGDRIAYLKLLFTGSTPYSYLPYGLAPYGALMRLLSYTIATLLGFSFLAVVPRREVRLQSRFGARTLQVYFWHLPLLFLLHTLDYQLCGTFLATVPWGYCVSILLSVGIALLLSTKPFAFPTNLIKKLTFQTRHKKKQQTF